MKSINYHFWIIKVLKKINNRLITVLNRMDRLKHRIGIIFGRSTEKSFRKKFVIKNKLSLSDQMDKSMHYPESPKVTTLPYIIILSYAYFNFIQKYEKICKRCKLCLAKIWTSLPLIVSAKQFQHKKVYLILSWAKFVSRNIVVYMLPVLCST